MSGHFGVITFSKEEHHTDDFFHLAEFHKIYGNGSDEIKGWHDTTASHRVSLGSRVNDFSNSSSNRGVFESEDWLISTDALIFNRNELLSKFAPDPSLISSYNDSELLYHCFLTYGSDFVNIVDGDYSLATYEKATGILTLWRDQFGVRPLFYCFSGSSLFWGTDLRSFYDLLKKYKSTQLNLNYFGEKLRKGCYFEREQTVFSNVKIVPASHRISLSWNQVKKSWDVTSCQYWTPKLRPIWITADEAKRRVRQLVEQAIEKRVKATSCNIGCDVSGGLDSTVLACYLKKMRPESSYYQTWSPSTAEFPLEDKYSDERFLTRNLEEKYDITCQYLSYRPESVTKVMERAEQFVKVPLLSDGFELLSGLQYFMGNDVKLALSGNGGDQGVSHHGSPESILASGDIAHYLREIYYTDGKNPAAYISRLCYHTPRKLFLRRRPKKFNECITSAFCGPTVLQKGENQKSKYLDMRNPANFINGSLQVRIENFCYLAAEYGLQYTYPLLDRDLVEFCLSLPQHMFFKNGKTRWVYRQAFSDLFSEELISNRKKTDQGRFDYKDQQLKVFHEESKERLMNKLDEQAWDEQILNIGSIQDLCTIKWKTLSPHEKTEVVSALEFLVSIQEVLV